MQRPLGDEVHLWHLDFDRLSNPLGQGAGVPSAELSVFQQRATRRFYLRLLLGAYLGLPGKEIHISRRIRGRPELASSQLRGELNFSVARSGSCYLIGVSSGTIIGVDLEVADRRAGRPLALARRYFSPAETAALSRLEGDELRRAFIHTWACKEAVVKASGLGIANQLCRFTVEVDPRRPPAVLEMEDDDPGAWQMASAEPAAGSIAVIAVRQPALRLTGFSLR